MKNIFGQKLHKWNSNISQEHKLNYSKAACRQHQNSNDVGQVFHCELLLFRFSMKMKIYQIFALDTPGGAVSERSIKDKCSIVIAGACPNEWEIISLSSGASHVSST